GGSDKADGVMQQTEFVGGALDRLQLASSGSRGRGPAVSLRAVYGPGWLVCFLTRCHGIRAPVRFHGLIKPTPTFPRTPPPRPCPVGATRRPWGLRGGRGRRWRLWPGRQWA